MRWLAGIAGLILAVLAAVGAPAGEDDRGLLERWIEDALSGAGREVRIEGFRGALGGRAELDALTIADADGVWLTLRDGVIDWNRAALLSGELRIAALKAGRLTIARLPVSAPAPADGLALPDLPAPAARPFALPELPVGIEIGALAIDRLELGAALLGEELALSLAGSARLSGGAGAAVLDIRRIDGRQGQIRLDARFANDTRLLSLELSAREPAGGAVARLLGVPGAPALALDVAGSGPLDDFAADLALSAGGVERLAGRLSLRSPNGARDAAGAVAASLSLAGDVRPLVAERLRPFFGPRFVLEARGGRAAGGGWQVEALKVQADQLRIEGGLALGADLWPRAFDLRVLLADPGGRAVALPWPGPAAVLDSARLVMRFDAARDDSWQAELEMRGFSRGGLRLATVTASGAGRIVPPGDGVGAYADGQITGRVEGIRTEDPALADAVGREIGARFGLAIRPGGQIDLRDIELAAGEARLTGTARLRPGSAAADMRIDLEAAADLPRLARFAGLAGRPLGGALRGTVRGSIAPLTGGFDLEVEGTSANLATGIAALGPLLDGEGTFALAARRDGAGTEVRALRLRTQRLAVAGRGRLGVGDGAGRIEVAASELRGVAPGLAGPARAVLAFARAGERIDLDVQASGPGGAQVAASATAELGGGVLRRLEGRFEARAERLEPYGGLAGRRLAGGLEVAGTGRLDLASMQWRLSVEGSSTDLSAGFDAADALLGGAATFSVDLRRVGDAPVFIEAVRFASPALQFSGTGMPAEGNGWDLDLTARLADAGLLARGLDGVWQAGGQLGWRAGGWRLGLDLGGPGGLSARLAGVVGPRLENARLTLKGTAPAAIANRAIAPRVASGRVAFDLALDGPLAVESLRGEIVLDDGALAIPDLPLTLRALAARVQLGQGRAQLAASGQSAAGGRLAMTGQIGLAAPYLAELRLELERLGLRRPGLVETDLTGAVALRGPLAGAAAVSGRLALGATELRIPDGESGVSEALDGVVHKHLPPQVAATLTRAGIEAGPGAATGAGTGAGPGAARVRSAAYALDIAVDAPSRVFLRGRGLDAELGGAIRLQGTTADIRPSGRFELVRGRFDILGKRLSLSRANLTLRGGLDPTIEVVATTSAGGIDAAIRLDGNASAPRFSLTSTPPLPEDEILARILFGRELSRISPLQALRLAASLATLAGNQSADVLDGLRSRFGLDEFDITSAEDGQTRIRAGRYLSERLYSGIEVDSTGRSTINLDLSITPALTARGRLDAEGGTGLGLFFERDY